MAINDVDRPGSDGWWMQEGWLALKDQRYGLTRLENYRRGTPDVVMGSKDLRSAFYQFQQQCRLTVADLVVQALTERLAVRTIRTAAGSDSDGDVQATRMWEASGMAAFGHSDLNRMLATYGRACTSTSAPDFDGGWPSIKAEDPRECVVIPDVNGKRVAAFKLFHDRLARVDYAILWRPGRKLVAVRENATRPATVRRDRALREPRLNFVPSAFSMRPEEPEDWTPSGNPLADLLWSESYSEQTIPIVEQLAPEGVGVFERHTDLIDQINHVILQGMVISTLQAFKQRALELTEDLPKFDNDGNEIDYNDLFSADPGALWKLPLGAKIWESGAVDITGILQQAKDAIQRFASMTRTPFSMFSSDSVNQSAEGAQLTREGLVFKGEDYQRIETRGLIESFALGFRFMPDEIRYAEVDGARIDRADVAGMSIEWLPVERYSLAEKAQADSQATSLPRRQRLSRIWGLTPAEVDIAMGQVAEDALLATPPAGQAPQRTPRELAAAAS